MRFDHSVTQNVGVCAAAACVLALASAPVAASTIYFNGFETNTAGWDVFGGTNDATRVASGTNGVTSAAGGFHALAAGPNNGQTDDGSAATNWGGYGFNPGCTSTACAATPFPASGFTTSLDIYLDLGATATNDTRFDWDSAMSNSAGGFLRDFVFNGGFYNDTDSTGTGPRFVISASNNATRGSAFPKNPGRDPFAIASTGWYTFQHHFYDNGGFLADELSILDSSDNELHTWTLTTTDAIATVGGNRYGWVVFNEFTSLAIDNAELTITDAAVPEPGSLALLGLGLAGLGLKRRRKS